MERLLNTPQGQFGPDRPTPEPGTCLRDKTLLFVTTACREPVTWSQLSWLLVECCGSHYTSDSVKARLNLKGFIVRIQWRSVDEFLEIIYKSSINVHFFLILWSL